MKSFPFIRQHDAMQCGIACLQMVAKNAGVQYSATEMGKICPVTSDGVSILALNKAAISIGFDVRCGRFSLDELRSFSDPCILYWNQCHYVVLYKTGYRLKRKCYYIADPAKGKRIIYEEEIKKQWISTMSKGKPKGIALLLHETSKIKEQNTRQSCDSCSPAYMLSYLKRYKHQFGQLSIGFAVGCLLQVLFPILTQSIVDFGINAKDINFIYIILFAQVAMSIGSALLDYIRRWIMLHLCMHLNISLISDFFMKLFELPMPFFDTKQTGDIMQRMGDHTRVQNFLTSTPLSLSFSVVSCIALCFVLYVYDHKIFFVFVIFNIISALWISFFLSRRRYLNYELFEKQALVQNKTLQLITSMQEIKLQNCKDRKRWEWEDCQVELLKTQEGNLKLSISEDVGNFLINSIKNIIITVLSAKSVIDGNISFGMMLAIQTIIGMLSSPVSQIINLIYNLQDLKISLERINEVKCLPSESQIGDGDSDIPAKCSLCIKNMNFKYDINAQKWTLKDINLNIPNGKTVAIVGLSGSGKTTLLKLILGYYTNFEGDIFLDDKPLWHYDINAWRNQCGVVMQEGQIFTDSIARNIATSGECIDMERLVNAAKMACIYDFIQQLPLGFDTIIGQDGKGLSMGQKQRIMIARAIYRDPPYIFFDEATNSLDTTNERNIINNLDKFFRNKTVFIIAHRLSTVRNADMIVVIEAGRIVEKGAHEDLVSKHGCYYSLIQNQIDL